MNGIAEGYEWSFGKNIKTKLTNLVKLGINKYKAYEWANKRKAIGILRIVSFSAELSQLNV